MKWIKDNGQEIETNNLPDTIAYCESIGWERSESDNTDDEITEADIQAIAKQCYDAKRKYLKSIDEDSLPIWSKADESERIGAVGFVKHVMENPDITPDGEQEKILVQAAKTGLSELIK